ncbi:uncharacterized protein LOC100900482 [Galendromus occidentalis]|uniref:peptidylprolyl isomerase n=1 Tax=Galendromus occidentalis TaxID=34638 RepID=A0AAJ6QQF5_9ACAR|nr:uncharacterized protein LOC100900482 [Galendromus occidentalis]
MDKISVDELKSSGEPLLPDLLYKLTIAAGAGDTVQGNSEVEVELRLILKGQTVLEYSDKPFVKHLDQILPTGLSIALSTMCQGERSLIWMDSSLAFGPNPVLLGPGVKIPKDSNLVFEVQLKSWNDKPAPSKLRFKNRATSESFSLIQAELLKAETLMENGRKNQAYGLLKSCLHSARRLKIDCEKAREENDARENLVHYLTVKSAGCAYELGKYPQAVSLSKEALEMDRFDSYVNYICGCACFSLGLLAAAIRYMRAAHHNDLENPVYEKKLREIEKHQALLEKDIDFDSDKEETEEYAAVLLQKLTLNEKKLRRDIKIFVNEQFETERIVLVGGGFRPSLLRGIADKIQENSMKPGRNPGIRVINTKDDVLKLSR